MFAEVFEAFSIVNNNEMFLAGFKFYGNSRTLGGWGRLYIIVRVSFGPAAMKYNVS